MSKIAIVAGIVATLLVILFIKLWPDTTTIAWNQAEGYRWARLRISEGGGSGFSLMPENKTGMTSVNTLTKEQIIQNRHLLNGAGVALGDVDGDGLVDIYLCRLNGPNALYKNLGNWKFKDIAEEAGVACSEQFSTGCTFADIDGDGDLDLLVTAIGGPNACFLNNGAGHFTDFTKEAGISSNTGAMTIALADIDGDSDLDLYITNNKKRTVRDLYPPHLRTIERTVKKVGDTFSVLPEFKEHYSVQVKGDYMARFEYAEPDMFFLNDGKGHFSKKSFTDGSFLDEEGNPVPDYTDWGLTVRLQDMDNDGDPDIYVCNDFASPDRIWINDGSGNFQAIPKLAIRSTSSASMGIDFSDIDRDGDLDFFLAEMLSRKHSRRMTQEGPVSPIEGVIGEIDNRPQYMKNTLFLNRGDNTYAEIANYSGVVASEWSWTPIFLDVDLDGYEDLLIATGHYYDGMDVDSRLKLKTMSPKAYKQMGSSVFAYPPLALPNFIFRNRGDLTFEEVGQKWGFSSTDVSHGMAVGDLDNDGDLDIIMNRFDQAPAVYRNESEAVRIAVRLKGSAPNTQAIGAKIRVLGGPVPQSKEVVSGGNYLSHSDHLYSFAAGEPKTDLSIEVNWRSGKRSSMKDIRPNHIYEIYEPDAKTDSISQRDGIVRQTSPDLTVKPFFKDVSHLINHKHHEEPYNDFRRQPLLPNRMSQLGPGVAWLDFDNDGDEDLFVTSGTGGEFAGLENNGHGKFNRLRNSVFTTKVQNDQTAVLGYTRENSKNVLLVGFSNYENAATENSFIIKYETASGTVKSKQKLLFNKASLGPGALADYDSDGDLDLFVGGRNVPDRYPEPASSQMFLNENGTFKRDGKNTNGLENLGMVTGAVFSDIDNDADPDLILSLEWGPITILRNEKGLFTNATEELGLAEYTGWWNGITTGDLNEDGRLDIIATNWGLNSKYSTALEKPLKIYFKDFDNNGTVDILEAYFDSEKNSMVPQRSFASIRNAMPFVSYNTRTNKEFGEANLADIIGPRFNQAREVEAGTLANMVFLNLGNSFQATPMPPEAQFSPGFHAGVADFDGDGHEDVFLSQNFFASRTGTHRSDAGRGLWLKGDGGGNLQAIPGQISGIKVYGEQRGAALGDYDQDGRVDLVVTQNGATTKLYRNVGAKPGLRVRLAGSRDNPSGVGAIIRVMYESGYGPAREVHAGSGYWSQNSVVQVMGTAGTAEGIWVRWPDGRISETYIPEGAKEITVNYSANEANVNR